MSIVAMILAFVILVLGAFVRAGGASLVRTSRADALHDAAEGDRRAERVATLLEDRPILQPALGAVVSILILTAAVPAAWALTDFLSGWALLAGLIGLTVIVVLVGELLPGAWGRARPRKLAYGLS